MSTFFDPTPQQRRDLEEIAAGIPGVQHTLVKNHPQLSMADRGAHQQQLAGSTVLLTVADQLPAALDGLGVFQRTHVSAPPQIGIGRMSTGLGCPHAETDPDFLGLMVAFRTPAGRRIDFITINDPDVAHRHAGRVSGAAQSDGRRRPRERPVRLAGGAARGPGEARRAEGSGHCHPCHGADAPYRAFEQRVSAVPGPASFGPVTCSASSRSCPPPTCQRRRPQHEGPRI